MKVTLYLQNDFSLFSFIEAFLPSSTPGHESENLTPRRREERRGGDKNGRQIERPKRRDGDSWGGKGRVDQYLLETRNLRRSGVALLTWHIRHSLDRRCRSSSFILKINLSFTMSFIWWINYAIAYDVWGSRLNGVLLGIKPFPIC